MLATESSETSSKVNVRESPQETDRQSQEKVNNYQKKLFTLRDMKFDKMEFLIKRKKYHNTPAVIR